LRGALCAANSSTLGTAMPVITGALPADAIAVIDNDSARAMQQARRMPTEVRKRRAGSEARVASGPGFEESHEVPIH
jgi:hypothetical protein